MLIREIRLAKSGKLFDVKGRISALKMNGYDELIPCDLDRRKNGTLSINLWQQRLEMTLLRKVTRLVSQSQPVEQKATGKDQLMDSIDEFLKSHKIA